MVIEKFTEEHYEFCEEGKEEFGLSFLKGHSKVFTTSFALKQTQKITHIFDNQD